MSLLTHCVVVSSSTSVTATSTSRKSSVAVMKISKRIKEEKKHTGDSRHRCVSSPPFPSNNHRDAAAPSLYVMVVMVAVCLAKLGGRREEERGKKESQRRKEIQLNHVICLGRAQITRDFYYYYEKSLSNLSTP